MSRFRLTLIAAVLVVAVGVWIWGGKTLESPLPAGETGAVPAEDRAAPSSTPTAATTSPAALQAPGADAAGSGNVAPPAPPMQMTSSVMAGLPMVRSNPATPVEPGAVAVPAAQRESAQPPEPHADQRAKLENVRLMLRDFHTRMGGNPVGSNAEIMKAVMGNNEARANLGPPPGETLNEQGELVDEWGTPYFFHQLSRSSTEVRSAGPDRRMWTVDDLTVK